MVNYCPCGSGVEFALCCEPIIQGQKKAQTPEILMRSRYSAYTLAQTEYIATSMRGRALQGFQKSSAKIWAQNVTWLKLEVIKSYLSSDTQGFVEFSAVFLSKNNKIEEIHELSEFNFIDGQWYYTDGNSLVGINKYLGRKVPANTYCPCGSGRKFKSCHMQ